MTHLRRTVPPPLGITYKLRGRVCLVAANPPSEPAIRADAWTGPLVDPGRYLTHDEALKEAAALVAQGWCGVGIWHHGALVNAWPQCRAPMRIHEELSAARGEPWVTHTCGRHDLHADGRCAEHTREVAPPVTGARLVQPKLFEEVTA